MTTPLEAVNEQLATLTNQVKELVEKHGSTQGWDSATAIADFKLLLDAQSKALLEQMPARPGEAQGDDVQRAAINYTGKYRRELLDIAKHGEHKVGSWKLRATDLFLAKLFLDKANEIKAQYPSTAGADKLRPASDDLSAAVKLLTSTGAGAGDELVPTGMATEIWQDFFAASRITNDLPSSPMPTDPFDAGLIGTVTWRKGGQGAAVASQNPTTAKSTLTSTEQIAEVDWAYNLDEDSIVAMMPELRAVLSVTGGEQMDDFVLNADATATATGNINLDDDTPAADAFYLADGQNGIRRLWIVDNTGQANSGGGDALADADVVAALNDLGKYGLDYQNVRIVPGIESYFAMLGLTNVSTFDKYGQFATIIQGELARYRGVPVLPSASHRKCEADYKVSVTAGNNTLGSFSVYNRTMWKAGFRRGLTIEVDRDIRSRQLFMVASFRIAIGCRGTRSAATHTAGAGNFTL